MERYPEYIRYPGQYWEESPRAGQSKSSFHFNFITEQFSSVVRDDGKNVMNTMNNRLVACWFLTKTRLIALCYLTAILSHVSPTNKSVIGLKLKVLCQGTNFRQGTFTGCSKRKKISSLLLLSFRETMESDAMWQFIEQEVKKKNLKPRFFNSFALTNTLRNIQQQRFARKHYPETV